MKWTQKGSYLSIPHSPRQRDLKIVFQDYLIAKYLGIETEDDNSKVLDELYNDKEKHSILLNRNRNT